MRIFKNVPCSHHRGVKNTKGVTQEFRLITKPAQEAVKIHKRSLSNILVKFKSAPLGSVMERFRNLMNGCFGSCGYGQKNAIKQQH